MFTNTPEGGQPTFVGLTCMWSGVKPKEFDENLFARHKDNRPFKWIKKDGTKMDLIWDYFEKPKFQARYQGPNPYCNGEEYFKYNQSLENVKRCPTEELCIFSEVHKKDYDFFWHHSSIIKSGVFLPGPYDQGRIPSLIPYDIIRKDKELKRKVYIFGITRYREVIRYIQDMTDEIIVVSSDHGTMVDKPFTPDQIDEIPVIVNRKNIDMSDINFQWDFKKLILRLKELE